MDPDEVERYSMGDFSEEESAPYDEHLLVCDRCREEVERSDAYVAAMRRAARQLRKIEALPKRRRPVVQR